MDSIQSILQIRNPNTMLEWSVRLVTRENQMVGFYAIGIWDCLIRLLGWILVGFYKLAKLTRPPKLDVCIHIKMPGMCNFIIMILNLFCIHYPRKNATENLKDRRRYGKRLVVRRCQEEEKSKRRSFLSSEEAGLIEISGLSTHERFLCRLTISSLNLLRVIAEQEGYPIEELNAGRICDWFMKDKLKREQDLGSAVLQWDESDFQF